MRRLLPCLAAFLICEGCGHPYADRFTTQKPRSQDVVGLYKLNRQTVTAGGLSPLNGRVSVVELHADGKFVAVNVPSGRAPTPDRDFFSKLWSGSGNWRIDVCGAVDGGFGREQRVWGVYLESPGAEIEPAKLTGARPPYGMIFTIGDSDAGQVIMFERQN
jgi:hypothetical protein